MTIHEPRTGKARMVGRFLWHYLEMAIAMVLGMLLLGLVWSAVLPEDTRFDVETLIMAADMTIGMALWMRVRRHGWASIAEMGLAMFVPFLILLVPYWFDVLSGHLVTSIGHTLMFVFMALAMLLRRKEYTQHQHQHQHRLRIRPKWAWRAAVVLVVLGIPAAVAAVNTLGKFDARYAARADTVTVEPAPKAADHDPAKPTVAFLLSSKGTNAADLLGPYETLSGTGRLNTYVVSASAQLVPLTGGLDLAPDLTFDGLARLLSERHDRLDAVVVPALQEPAPAERDAINTWLRQQSAAGALTVSVCRGAQALAEAGLLDGRPATSHWLRLDGLRDGFPKVNWVGGTRYVDDGNVITTAGVLSGIDGGLRIIERLFDVNAAHEAARKVHWRHYVPGASAPIPESRWEPQDVAMALNAAYETGPSTIGVQLTDGAGELALAAAFISYTEQSMVARTIAVGDGPIRSRHGLTFVPRSTVAAAGDLDRLLMPGAGNGEFAFDPVLRDIARTYDVPTARFAAKTLEYPVMDVELTGPSWPWLATLTPVLLALLGAAAAIAGGIVFRRVARHRSTRTVGWMNRNTSTAVSSPAPAR